MKHRHDLKSRRVITTSATGNGHAHELKTTVATVATAQGHEHEQARVVKVTCPKAKAYYECFGCGGEVAIPKGEVYARITLSDGRRIHSHHYCMRCWYALQSKKSHAKGAGVIIEQGGLKWSRLSAAFRQRWTELNKNLRAAQSEADRAFFLQGFCAWCEGGER